MAPSPSPSPGSTGSSSFTSIAPGRLCLFGEHQDYLHLPVIALAIPLYCRIEVTPKPSSRVLELHVPAEAAAVADNDDDDDEAKTTTTVRYYNLDNLPPSPRQQQEERQKEEDPDFALAALHEAIRDGWEFPCGASCASTSEIVMKAGCSSSTAFVTAWILVLAGLASNVRADDLTPMELAKRAHRAEVGHFGNPGGTMDHVTIALGGCLRIGPGPWQVNPLPPLVPETHGIWILADSGEPKDTMKHLQRCKGDRLALLQKLNGTWDNNDAAILLSEEEQRLLRATQRNRDTESEAASLWLALVNDTTNATTTTTTSSSATTVIGQKLGALMYKHHCEGLRDGLKLSTSRLESIGQAAMDAGAWGYKLVGSGGGGHGVAWAPKHLSTNIASAMKEIGGAKQTWIMEQRTISGARIL